MTGCQAINNIFFPEICSSCGEINDGFLCEKCRNSIIEIKKISCHLCGAPFVSDKHEFPSNDKSSFLLSDELFQKSQNPKINPKLQKICHPKKDYKCCRSCRDGDYSFHKLRSFGLYTGVLKKLIIKFKYRRIFTLAPVLNGFLKKVYIENFADKKIDYVDTVPDFLDFKSSLALPAFYDENHMKILAELFAAEIGIPYGGNILKIKKTSKQQNLGEYERKVNLEGAFKAADMLRAYKKNILLVDDVWTTGNTLNQISKALKNCGAQKIYLLTIARTI